MRLNLRPRLVHQRQLRFLILAVALVAVAALPTAVRAKFSVRTVLVNATNWNSIIADPHPGQLRFETTAPAWHVNLPSDAPPEFNVSAFLYYNAEENGCPGRRPFSANAAGLIAMSSSTHPDRFDCAADTSREAAMRVGVAGFVKVSPVNVCNP